MSTKCHTGSGCIWLNKNKHKFFFPNTTNLYRKYYIMPILKYHVYQGFSFWPLVTSNNIPNQAKAKGTFLLIWKKLYTAHASLLFEILCFTSLAQNHSISSTQYHFHRELLWRRPQIVFKFLFDTTLVMNVILEYVQSSWQAPSFRK